MRSTHAAPRHRRRATAYSAPSPSALASRRSSAASADVGGIDGGSTDGGSTDGGSTNGGSTSYAWYARMEAADSLWRDAIPVILLLAGVWLCALGAILHYKYTYELN